MEQVNKLNLDYSYRVTLHRNLIEADFSRPLTILEQKILYAAISNIPAPKFEMVDGKKVIVNPIKELPTFVMSVQEFSELLGWKTVDYAFLKKKTAELLGKVITVKSIENNDIEQLQWLTYVRYLDGKGSVQIELHQRLLPFIANLTENFASVSLGALTNFSSKYASRLYLFAKQWEKIGQRQVPIEDVRKMLGVGFTEKNGERVYKLRKYSHLTDKALFPALADVNEATELNVDFEQVREGQRIVALNFIITKKEDPKKKAPKKAAPKKVEEAPAAAPQKVDTASKIANSIGYLGYNSEAYENIAKHLRGIEDLETVENDVTREIHKLAQYVSESGNLGAGFVIKQVEKAVEQFAASGKFEISGLTAPKTYAARYVKRERVPEWFNKREKEAPAASNNKEEIAEEIDFEAEKAKLIAKLRGETV